MDTAQLAQQDSAALGERATPGPLPDMMSCRPSLKTCCHLQVETAQLAQQDSTALGERGTPEPGGGVGGLRWAFEHRFHEGMMV